jgi:signal transduction histidine kinase
MSTHNRINKFISRFPNKRTSFIVWELFIGLAISAAVFFNTDQDINNSQRFIKFLSNSSMIIIIVGLSWLSMNNKYFKKYRIYSFLFLFVKIMIIFYMVENYGYGLNSFLYLIIPFEAYFTISEDIGVIISLLMIMLIFINHKFGRSLLQEVSLAWTFISLNLLFLILAMFLMRDYQNDQLKSDLLEKLQKSHRLLEEYARNVAEFTIIEERNRIAREIHDSVGHYLTAVNLQLERASIYLDKDPDEVKQAVQAAKLASTEALKDVRTSVSMLRNEDDLFDFKNEIQKLIDGITSTYQVKYEYIGSAKNYNHSVLLVLFRSLQESITNIQKHAKASQINITFDFKKNNCILSITDNGIGFDLEKVNTQNSFGIAGVKERVELVQGEITINSTLSGTSIVIIVPADPVLKLSESGQS